MPKCLVNYFFEIFDMETGMFLTKFVFEETTRMSTIEINHINKISLYKTTNMVRKMGICLEHNLVRGPSSSLSPKCVYGHILGDGILNRFYWMPPEYGITKPGRGRQGVQVGLPYGRVAYTPLREFVVVGVVHYPELGVTVRFSSP